MEIKLCEFYWYHAFLFSVSGVPSQSPPPSPMTSLRNPLPLLCYHMGNGSDQRVHARVVYACPDTLLDVSSAILLGLPLGSLLGTLLQNGHTAISSPRWLARVV